ncbi:MAG: MFS transporter [Planctomycetota bacterium]|nr:MFS transporter [Planctomycetota bacterium]
MACSLDNPLCSRGFVGLNIIQFIGAANDNLLKQILLFALASGGVWSGALGPGGQAYIGLAFTLPFVIFSPWFGQFADRWSKTHITWIVRSWEVVTAVAVVAAFALQSPVAGLVCMFFLAVQAALYSPAKYGMIPELVPPASLTAANGVLNMLTNVAIIAGTAVAGPLYAWYAQGALFAPGGFILILAIIGLVSCALIPKLEPRAPTLKVSMNIPKCAVVGLIGLYRNPVFPVALMDAIFYALGMLALLALPDFQAPSSGGLSPMQITVLLLILSLSIGAGGLICARLSRVKVHPLAVPIGCVGMALSFGAIGLLPVAFFRLCIWIGVGGLASGVVVVSLQTMLLVLTKDDERGRVIGAVNTLSFLLMAAASGLYILLRNPRLFGLDAHQVFLVCAAIAVPGVFAAQLLARTVLGVVSASGDLSRQQRDHAS